MEEVESGVVVFILGGNSCFQYTFPTGLSECSGIAWKPQKGKEQEKLTSPPFLPGPSELLPLLQGSHSPTSCPCALAYPVLSPETSCLDLCVCR